MYRNEVEIGVMYTVMGKRYFTLTVVGDTYGASHRMCVVDATGKPKMWTRINDVLMYANRMGYIVRSGYNFMGGSGGGNPDKLPKNLY